MSEAEDPDGGENGDDYVRHGDYEQVPQDPSQPGPPRPLVFCCFYSRKHWCSFRPCRFFHGVNELTL